MPGKFILKSKTQLKDLNIGDILDESDFSHATTEDEFLQFKYETFESKYAKYDVEPGMFKICKSMQGFYLQPTSFAKDTILEEFVNTKEVEEIVDCFFNNLHVYSEMGIEIPKRNLLLWGAPGTGKTTSIAVVARKYLADNRTAIVTWDSNAFEAFEVKSFISSFDYKNLDKIILIVEDIGGAENEGQRVRQDSSLLSLLDNSDKTFNIPVMIISTTNHPENLGAAIANRSGRFDDKIQVGFPNSEARAGLLNFFSKNTASKEALDLIKSNKCSEFPPSHIREAYVRSRLRSKPLEVVITDMMGEIEQYKKAFTKPGRGLGLGS